MLTGIPWARHHLLIVSTYSREVTVPECQLCKGLLSKNTGRKKSFFSHKNLLFDLGPFHRAGLPLYSGHWAEGGMEMVLFGEGNITYWGLSLRAWLSSLSLGLGGECLSPTFRKHPISGRSRMHLTDEGQEEIKLRMGSPVHRHKRFAFSSCW